MNNVQNKPEGLTQIFAGENGPVLGGMLGIVFLVGMHYIVKGNYKFSAQSGENSISLQPVSHMGESVKGVEVKEDDAEKTEG